MAVQIDVAAFRAEAQRVARRLAALPAKARKTFFSEHRLAHVVRFLEHAFRYGHHATRRKVDHHPFARANPDAASVRADLAPMEATLREGCIGQLPEIYNGDAPAFSRGCFAQAWSVGEMLRVYETLEKIERV